jgi:hypothetical protein
MRRTSKVIPKSEVLDGVLWTLQRKQIGARSAGSGGDDEREGGNLRREVGAKEFEGLQENAQVLITVCR